MDDDEKELSAIAAEQRRELMAARVDESDLDLAFRLQLEEAMAASLALQPSSSASQTQSQQSTLMVVDDDASTNFVDLQTLELDKFETEIRDRVLIQAETKKMQADLQLRIHDQKLAREILHMPEEDWREFGDNVERPYGEGSSSNSNNEGSSEVFRVYFKGLLSEERVGGIGSSTKTVTLAGIGVAICDSMDELIFEMRKPLDLAGDDQMNRRSVEWKALIEALNSAAALDLKRIIFCCDYYTLHQYVTGRWVPRQSKIITIVNHVNLLREKFKSAVPSLIARNDVKFAFKLAREAIVSQLNKPIEFQSSHQNLQNCVICLDDKPLNQFFTVNDCKHQYCFSCMKQHVEVKLFHGMVPKCPHEGCGFELKIESCDTFLTPKLIEMMGQRLKEASIPVTEKIYCPYPKCSALMSKIELLRIPRFCFDDAARKSCLKCHGEFCMNCRVPWHNNINCAEYRRRNPTQLVEESKLKNLAARNLWRQCVKCKHMIELAAGCYHMTCRCGYEFCYTCGAEWRNKKPTCNCPLWDEENIVDTDTDNEDNVEYALHAQVDYDSDIHDDYDSDTDGY